MPQLETATYFSQLFWLVICFGAIILFSWGISLPRLSKLQGQRWDQIEGKKELASTLQIEAEALQNACAQELEIARQQAQEIVLHVDREIKLKFEHERKRISQEMKDKIQATEKKFLQEKQNLSKEIPQIAQKLAIEIIQKTLPKETSLKTVRESEQTDD
ncbi:MAG: hypothetical protein BGO77_06885 [Caedibacter sp. 37-49]|nr:MAG: hypothetical protein BGO77_06885 [Caedibacter sp. 37-49]